MDSSLELALDEILRRLDDLDARMEHRFQRSLAALDQQGAAANLRDSGATQLVEADNWGGLFDEVPAPHAISFDFEFPNTGSDSASSDEPNPHRANLLLMQQMQSVFVEHAPTNGEASVFAEVAKSEEELRAAWSRVEDVARTSEENKVAAEEQNDDGSPDPGERKPAVFLEGASSLIRRRKYLSRDDSFSFLPTGQIHIDSGLSHLRPPRTRRPRGAPPRSPRLPRQQAPLHSPRLRRLRRAHLRPPQLRARARGAVRAALRRPQLRARTRPRPRPPWGASRVRLRHQQHRRSAGADARVAGCAHPSPPQLQIQEVYMPFIHSCALPPDPVAGNALRPEPTECAHDLPFSAPQTVLRPVLLLGILTTHARSPSGASAVLGTIASQKHVLRHGMGLLPNFTSASMLLQHELVLLWCCNFHVQCASAPTSVWDVTSALSTLSVGAFAVAEHESHQLELCFERLNPLPDATCKTDDCMPTKYLMYCHNGFTSMLVPTMSSSAPTWESAKVNNNFEHESSAPTVVSTLGKHGQMLKRYITGFTHAFSIAVVMFYSASEIHCVKRVFVKLVSQYPVQFWPISAEVVVEAPYSPFLLFEIKGDAIRVRPSPWPFFCAYATPVHLETSLSVNTLLVYSTQICLGVWSPFYLGWSAVQSRGSVVQILVWPILIHEISAANMERFMVSIQHKGNLLNPDVVFHKPLSGLYAILHSYGYSKENILSAMLVMSKCTLSYMVQNEFWLELLQSVVQVAELNNYLIIDRRTGLLLGVDKWGLIIPPTYMHQGVFLVVSEHVLIAVTVAETGATLWLFPVVVCTNRLCCHLLWKSPWQQPALVVFTDDSLAVVVDDADEEYEHEAEDIVLAESTVKNVAAPTTLPKDITGRHLSKKELKKQEVVQFPWDPGGSELLHRLGGKPKLKKGGMSGSLLAGPSYGPWAWVGK